MLKSLFTLTLISTHLFLSAQAKDLWLFGNPAIAVDFSGGAPINIPYTGNPMFSTTECSAVLNDDQGNLLFYTQGDEVYDGSHAQVPNAFDLFGNPTSCQGALFVPLPGSTDSIYLFTTAMQAGFSPNPSFPNEHSGMCYSIIDRTLNFGLGELVPSTKNTELVAQTPEKLTAIRHSNGRDIWIITVEWATANMYAFLLRPDGLCGPVVTNIGTSHVGGSYNSASGQLKANHAGTMVSHTLAYSKLVDLYDFDNYTGKFSNARTFDFGSETPYGVEFSPNDQFAYYSASGTIYQMDVSLGTQAAIEASKTAVSNTGASPSSYAVAIQIGPDNKIYWSKCGNAGLGVIHQPDIAGNACNATPNGLALSSNPNIGLPNFFKGDVFVEDLIGMEEIDFTHSNLCADNEINFNDASKGDTLSYAWSFSDGYTENTQNVNWAAAAGSYTVNYTVSNACTTLTKDSTIILENCANNTFFIPSAFSPNGDGVNDVFRIRGNNIESILIRLYDRYGKVQLESNDPLVAWSPNTFSNQVMVYYINVEYKDGVKEEHKGSLTLIDR